MRNMADLDRFRPWWHHGGSVFEGFSALALLFRFIKPFRKAVAEVKLRFPPYNGFGSEEPGPGEG